VLRFWLRRGVGGFRVDASAVLMLLRDDPPDPQYDPTTTPPPQRLKRIFTDDRPECMDCCDSNRQICVIWRLLARRTDFSHRFFPRTP
jgi:alpha-glucosidase